MQITSRTIAEVKATPSVPIYLHFKDQGAKSMLKANYNFAPIQKLLLGSQSHR